MFYFYIKQNKKSKKQKTHQKKKTKTKTDARKILSSSIFVLCMACRSESDGYVNRRSVHVEER